MRGTHSHDLLVAGLIMRATASTVAHDEKVYRLTILSKLQSDHLCAFPEGETCLKEQDKPL
jgi:hypothetical protein